MITDSESTVVVARETNIHETTVPVTEYSTTGPTTLPSVLDNLADNQCTLIQDQMKCTDKTGYWCVNDGSLLCKPEPDGWLVWLRRVDGSVLFNRTWDEYAAGFGDPDGNYWLGLEKLHLLTGTGRWFKLRVEMGSWHYPYIEWAQYDDFSIGNNTTIYQLQVDGFTGNTSSDGLWYNRGKVFSTTSSCASSFAGGGGWWYGSCSQTFHTAVIGGPGDSYVPYMWWHSAFGTLNQALKHMTLKIAYF